MTRQESAKVETQNYSGLIQKPAIQSQNRDVMLDTVIRCSDIKMLWTLRRTFVTYQMFKGKVAIFAGQ